MLENATLYADTLKAKFQKVLYDMRYMYYSGGTGSYNLNIPDNNIESHRFASIDENGEVLGYIAYSVDYAAKSCYNFGAISFDIGNLTYTKDLRKAIDDIFIKYNMNRIDFFAFEDNPITPTYIRLVKKYGGRIVGKLTNNSMLMDGKLHSSMIFELTAKEYLKRRNKNNV